MSSLAFFIFVIAYVFGLYIGFRVIHLKGKRENLKPRSYRAKLCNQLVQLQKELDEKELPKDD